MEQLDIFSISNKPDNMSQEAWDLFEWFEYRVKTKCNTPIKALELSQKLGISDRDLRSLVEEVRDNADLALIGDTNGYYVGNKEQWKAFLSMRVERTKSSLRTTAKAIGGVAVLYQILNELKDEMQSQPISNQIGMGGVVKKTVEDYE